MIFTEKELDTFARALEAGREAKNIQDVFILGMRYKDLPLMTRKQWNDLKEGDILIGPCGKGRTVRKKYKDSILLPYYNETVWDHRAQNGTLLTYTDVYKKYYVA